MRSCINQSQYKNILFYLVVILFQIQKQPVRLNMTLPNIFKITDKLMIMIFFFKIFIFHQLINNFFKQRNIQPPFFCKLKTGLELRSFL